MADTEPHADGRGPAPDGAGPRSISGLHGRAADIRRLIRALEYEVATLERLGQKLERWLTD